MKILVIEPGKAPAEQEIDGSLEAMQTLVGGYIQAIYPFKEQIALICNDDGKLLGLTPNRAIRDESGEMCDVVCGTFFLCAAPADSENFESLTPEQIEKYLAYYRIPEAFLWTGSKILCLPIEEPSQ